MVRLAQTRRRFDQCVEYRLQVEGGAADHFEHIRGRRLLLQRFAEIIRALAQLVEQPRILDGDDSWCRKICKEGDLLVGKGTNFLPKDADDSSDLIVLQHRHSDHRPNAAEFDRSYGWRVALSVSSCCCEVDNMSR